MKPVDLMIFDLDGTLVASGKDVAASVNHTLNALGLSVIEERVIIEYIGDGVNKLIERSLGHALQDRFEEALAVYSRHYEEHMMDHTVLYSDVHEVLKHFHDKDKVILTNKRQHFAMVMSDVLGLTACFDDIVGADRTPYIKPDARLARPLLERFHANPERTVVIGDGINDILFARNAGLMSCACLNGLTNRNKLLDLKPEYSCEHLSEIKSFFC